ncbi:MAG: ATP-binding protein [Candidatus Obscuribacterales bacterium]|jgi:hypothetical protein
MAHATVNLNAHLAALAAFGVGPANADDIVTASFVQRSENLMLLGGPGTGKEIIARDIGNVAVALGMTSVFLPFSHDSWPHDELLQLRAHAFTGWERNPRPYREDLLNCDVLVVGESHLWLEAAPIVMLVLLSMRAEKGKSTILVATNDGWQHMLDEERFAAALAENNFHESTLIADLEDSDAVRFVKRSYGSQIARKELLASLGLDVITAVPYLPQASRYVGWNVIRCGSNGLKQHHFVQKS